MSASVTHAATYTFVTKWGSSGSDNGQFSHPEGVAVDSSGNIYVADPGNNRIQKFNSNGVYISQFGSYGSGDGQFNNPLGIGVDSSDNVYVADNNNHRIQKFDSNGNYLTQWGSWVIGDGKDFTPVGVTVDSSDNVYASDNCYTNHRIVKFNSNGYCLTQWGSQGSNNGQFNNPLGIAVDSSNNVYVVDRDNHRIQKFDSDGNYLMQWGSYGSSNGQFAVSVGIATDSSGNVYVADYDGTVYHVTDRIQKFDSDGNYLMQWGSYGSSNGQFDHSNYVVVDSSGYVYVSDTNNNRIQKFAPPILPVANFSTNVTKGYVPLSVQFTDLSKNATKWKWDFGDGANSTLRNPVHTYSKAGKYTANLTAANANGTDSKTAIITVSASPVLPVAKFSAKPTSGTAPLNVAFTDKSTGAPTSWKWTFGDGNFSTLQNPVYTYSKAGNYTVSLKVTNAAGTNTKTIKNYITVKAATPKPVAAFSATPTSGNVPLIVKFTDQSTGTPTSWKWSFGDGTYSTKKNPSYIYDEAGKYTVSLTVKNAAGSSTKTIKNYINVTTLKSPVAAFSGTPTSGNVPLKVKFTDKSTGTPTSWKWSFGDGSNSTSQNPAHTYSKVGKYTVSLTVKNAAGSNKTTKTNYINVITLKAPVAAFSASPTSGKVPLKVQFTDKSTNSPTSWKWTFGDGKNSTTKNPAYTYSKAGNYTVSLTVKNAKGSNTKTISGYIKVSKK